MIPDPQRLQYLEAMGITAWVSRYRFVNARPTEQGEWRLPDAPVKAAPGQRLQALLETPAPPVPARRSAREPLEPAGEGGISSSVARARALLEGTEGTSAGVAASSVSIEAVTTPEVSSNAVPEAALQREPLRFKLTLGVLGERWWLMLPGDRPPSVAGQKLLCQLLNAADLPPQWTPLGTLSWPLMEVPVSDPVEEAREGVQVFCAGQAQRNALAVDGAIVVGGGDETWSLLLGRLAEETQASDMTYHHWPHPDDLLASSQAKRDCWPMLRRTADAWSSGNATSG